MLSLFAHMHQSWLPYFPNFCAFLLFCFSTFQDFFSIHNLLIDVVHWLKSRGRVWDVFPKFLCRAFMMLWKIPNGGPIFGFYQTLINKFSKKFLGGSILYPLFPTLPPCVKLWLCFPFWGTLSGHVKFLPFRKIGFTSVIGSTINLSNTWDGGG